MNILDIIISVLFLPAVFFGWKKGFIKQMVELAVIFVTFLLSARYSAPLGTWFGQYIKVSPKVMNIICFVMILIASGAVLTLVGSIIRRVASAISLGAFDKLLGIMFCLLKFAFLISLILVAVGMLNDKFGFIDAETLDGSFLWMPLHDFAYNLIFAKILPAVQ